MSSFSLADFNLTPASAGVSRVTKAPAASAEEYINRRRLIRRVVTGVRTVAKGE
jgi:hypothetical protein